MQKRGVGPYSRHHDSIINQVPFCLITIQLSKGKKHGITNSDNMLDGRTTNLRISIKKNVPPCRYYEEDPGTDYR